MKKTITISILTVALMITSCNQEYLNPSSASQQQVVSDVNGLIALANGLQYKYTISRQSPGYAAPSVDGLLTKYLIVLNAGNTDELLLSQGGAAVVGSNSVVTNLWNQSLLVKSNAELILNNLGIVTDQGTKGALYAHAAIFKALALGNLATYWKSAPTVTQKNAPFVDRIDVLNEAIALLEGAVVELAKAPISATFTARIVPGIDYANTLNALIARYALMAGQYDKALAAANLVNLAVSVKSGFNHDDLTRNTMFDNTFGNKNVTEPPDALFTMPAALQTSPSDGRINFFFNPAASATVNRAKASFFQANTTTVPIYRGGEITLIKAECYVRKTPQDLAAAKTQLNIVLQKTAAQDAWGIGANLPAYGGPGLQADLLDEIYKQRCIELYLTGLRVEDMRRFGRPTTERGRDFLPYPFTERDNNPANTPVDPAF
jgi:hypothetical protein